MFFFFERGWRQGQEVTNLKLGVLFCLGRGGDVTSQIAAEEQEVFWLGDTLVFGTVVAERVSGSYRAV